MFISSKIFVWHLSRRIVRIESAEKWAAIYRKKPSRNWLEKDQWESVISVQSLSCVQILFVGRCRTESFQRLQDRLKQHVPKSIRSCSSSQKRLLPARWCKSSIQTNTQSLASDSAIGLHLLQNPTCAQHYDDCRFSILAQGRSPFHLSALEATFIKTSNSALCRKKEFVYSLNIKVLAKRLILNTRGLKVSATLQHQLTYLKFFIWQ